MYPNIHDFSWINHATQHSYLMNNHTSLSLYIHEQSCNPIFISHESIMQLCIHIFMKQSCILYIHILWTIMHPNIHILWNNHACFILISYEFFYFSLKERQSTYMLTIIILGIWISIDCNENIQKHIDLNSI